MPFDPNQPRRTTGQWAREGGPGSGPQGGKGGKPASSKSAASKPVRSKGAAPLSVEQEATLEQSRAAWGSKLSPEQKMVIEHYGNMGFKQINKQLRNPKPGMGYVEDYIAVMDKTMESSPPLEEPMLVYRGMGTQMFGGVPPEQLIGKRVTDKGYVSTSTQQSYATSWTKDKVVAHIRVPKGARGIVMNGLPQWAHVWREEHEFLLPHGTKFVVRSVSKDERGRTIVGMDVLPEK